MQINFKIILLVSSLFLSKNVYCQDYFNGTIISKTEIELKDDSYDKESLMTFFGSESLFSIKEGMSKSVTNSSPKRTAYYKGGKVYTKRSDNDTIFVTDATVSKEVIEDWKLLSNQAEILGYPCDLLKLQIFDPESGYRYSLSFYFNEELKINPDWYKGMKFQHSEFIYGKTRSVPIRTIIDDNLMRITINPISIKEQPLKGFESEFNSFISGNPIKE